MNRIWRVAVLSLVVVLAACAAAPSRDAASVATPQWRTQLTVALNEVSPTRFTSAQPAAGDWSHLAANGITTVVNLRTPDELAGRDEPAEVRAAGMTYHALPVDGIDGLRPPVALKLAAILDEADGPVLVHCASSDRAGALMALIAAHDGASARDALRIGQAAGMKRTEPRVRELLGVPETAAQ